MHIFSIFTIFIWYLSSYFDPLFYFGTENKVLMVSYVPPGLDQCHPQDVNISEREIFPVMKLNNQLMISNFQREVNGNQDDNTLFRNANEKWTNFAMCFAFFILHELWKKRLEFLAEICKRIKKTILVGITMFTGQIAMLISMLYFIISNYKNKITRKLKVVPNIILENPEEDVQLQDHQESIGKKQLKAQLEDLSDNKVKGRRINIESEDSKSTDKNNGHITQITPFGIDREAEEYLQTMLPRFNYILRSLQQKRKEYLQAEQEDENGLVSEESFISEGFSAGEKTSEELETTTSSTDIFSLPESKDANDIDSISKECSTFQSYSFDEQTFEEWDMEKVSSVKDANDYENHSEQEDTKEGSISEDYITSQDFSSDEELEMKNVPLQDLKDANNFENHSKQEDNDFDLISEDYISSQGFSSDEQTSDKLGTTASIADMSSLEESNDANDFDSISEEYTTSLGVPSGEQTSEELKMEKVSLVKDANDYKNHSEQEDNEDDSISEEYIAFEGFSSDEQNSILEVSFASQGTFSSFEDAGNYMGISDDIEDVEVTKLTTLTIVGLNENINMDQKIYLHQSPLFNEIIPEAIKMDGTVKLVLYTPDGDPYELNCIVIPDV